MKKLAINFLCQDHPKDCLFELVNFKQGEKHQYEKKQNCLIFFLKGKVDVISNSQEKQEFTEDCMMFLFRLTAVEFYIKEDTQLLIHTYTNSSFRTIRCILDEFYTYSKNMANEIQHNRKLHLVPAFVPYINSVMTYIQDNKGNSSIWYLKHQEAMHILSFCYSKTEITSFIQPMLSEPLPFKFLVTSYSREVKTVEELSDICGYDTDNFRKLFKKHFGVPVYQWLQDEKSKRVLHLITTTETPLKDIMREFEFTSPSHLNKFCKKHLGDTPSNIRAKNLNKPPLTF